MNTLILSDIPHIIVNMPISKKMKIELLKHLIERHRRWRNQADNIIVDMIKSGTSIKYTK